MPFCLCHTRTVTLIFYAVNDWQVVYIDAEGAGQFVDFLEFAVFDRLIGRAIQAIVVWIVNLFSAKVSCGSRLVDAPDVPALRLFGDNAL